MKSTKQTIFTKIKKWYQAKIEKEQSRLLDRFYKKEYQYKKLLYPTEDIDIEQLERFIFLPPDVKIEFQYNSINYQDELEHFNKLREIFKILERHNRNYNIKIKVDNRELLRKSGLLENTKNINLIIVNDYYQYTKEEFLEEELKLEELIYQIKESNLSPYEKFLAVYNIVKQFKDYKENNVRKLEARRIRYILRNEYMVCVGYAQLLTTLLDKVGIPSMIISATIAIPNEKKTSYEGHERNLIKIDDDKYNIHGIYVTDATWDNSIKLDLYNNASTTFNKRKESINLETLRKEDYLLDFNSFEEYCQKINFYLKRKMNDTRYNNYSQKLIGAYMRVYYDIMNILYKLDYEKWQYFKNKYKNLTKELDKNHHINQTDIDKYDHVYTEFLTEYGNYIIKISNQEIDENILYQAAETVKRSIEGFTEKEIEEWKNTTIELNNNEEEKYFPYRYNPFEIRPNYLISKSIIKKKAKQKSY